jgi:hypothetical protein
MQWAVNDRRSGALVIRRSEREKRIYFHAGEVIACVSNDPAEYYGQHLILNGYLKIDQLFEALTYCTNHGVRLGTALLDLGMLAPEIIQQTLRSQIEDVICDLFLWERGVFYFRAEMPMEEEILPEPIHAIGLIMEGTRWLDEYRRIRKVLAHDNIVLGRGTLWSNAPDRLPVERRIAREVDGQKTLAELYKIVRGSYFRFLEATYRLAIGRVLDIQVVGEPVDRSSHEMSLYDLLLEQATEEQVLVAHRHMAVPLDLLERFYPVWVAEPAAEEQKRMPAKARDFFSRFDGKTSLGDAFSGDPRLRGREMDLLMLQLQKGRLAILPAPVEAIEEEADKRGTPVGQRWWRKVFPA